MKGKRITHILLSIAVLLILTFLIFSGAFYIAAPDNSPLNCGGKAGMDCLLEQIPASNAADIKAILYKAPAAYRSFFIRHAAEINIENTTGIQCYDAGTKTVYINFAKAASDPRGPYTSFFHECAHAIDDQAGRLPMITLSESGKLTGNNLKKALEEDYRSFITGKVQEIAAEKHLPVQDETQIQAIILAMREESSVQAETPDLSGDVDTSCQTSMKACRAEESKAAQAEAVAATQKLSDKITFEEMRCDISSMMTYLENELCPTLCSPQEECLSDILGALSHNHLRGKVVTDQKITYGYGHENSYWEINGNLEKEFFAEYFSYQMTGNREALRKIAAPSFGTFPQAAAWVDRLIEI